MEAGEVGGTHADQHRLADLKEGGLDHDGSDLSFLQSSHLDLIKVLLWHLINTTSESVPTFRIKSLQSDFARKAYFYDDLLIQILLLL